MDLHIEIDLPGCDEAVAKQLTQRIKTICKNANAQCVARAYGWDP